MRTPIYMLNSILLTFALVFSGFIQGLSDEPVRISDFTLPNVVNGSDFSLSEFGNAKAVVVIFTSHYCPYAKLYEDRIANLIENFKNQNVRFILINSNNPQKSNSDSRENMARIANENNLTVPYLSDSNQKVADMFGVQKTPESFLLRRNNNSFEIVYRGALDDNPQVASDVNHPFLKDAIEAVLQGHLPYQPSNRPTGCMIKR